MATNETHRALVIESQETPPALQTRPTPTPGPGTVLLAPECASVITYSRSIYPPTNTRGYAYALPIVPGSSALARIVATGPDATGVLVPGTLVLFSCYVRGREDLRAGAARYLQGVSHGGTPASEALMARGTRDGAFTERMLVPVENVFVLDEARLLGPPSAGGLGRDPAALTALLTATVPYGGLRDVNLQPGETVAIVPATGGFGGAAVAVALAMGARVIAMGRRAETLTRVTDLSKRMGRAHLLDTLVTSGDATVDETAIRRCAGGAGLDVFFDISPPEAGDGGVTPAYLKAGIMALRHGGRASLMGGIRGDVSLPYMRIMRWDLTVKGKWMYEPQDVRDLIKMAEAGVFSFEWVDVIGRYPLAQWDEAWKTAEAHAGIGQVTVIEPQK